VTVLRRRRMGSASSRECSDCDGGARDGHPRAERTKASCRLRLDHGRTLAIRVGSASLRSGVLRRVWLRVWGAPTPCIERWLWRSAQRCSAALHPALLPDVQRQRASSHAGAGNRAKRSMASRTRVVVFEPFIRIDEWIGSEPSQPGVGVNNTAHRTEPRHRTAPQAPSRIRRLRRFDRALRLLIPEPASQRTPIGVRKCIRRQPRSAKSLATSSYR